MFNHGNGSVQHLGSVVHAFETLIDESRRAAYDQLRSRRSQQKQTAPPPKDRDPLGFKCCKFRFLCRCLGYVENDGLVIYVI